MNPRKISLINQKGGVGKTSSCRNLGWYMAEQGYKTLLIDLDSQGNLSKSFFPEEALGQGTYEALTGGKVTLMQVKERLELLSGDSRLAALEKQLVAELDGPLRLRELLAKGEFKAYDFIFMDCPPSLGMLSSNGLAAADNLIVPLNCSLFSMQGTNDLLKAVKTIKRLFNPDLELLGFLINETNPVPVIEKQINEEIRETFTEKVFKREVSRCVKLEEAIALSVGVTALNGKGTEKIKAEVEALGREILERLGMTVRQPAINTLSAGQGSVYEQG